MTSRIGPEAVERVLTALAREADLDGVATVPFTRLGALTNLSSTSARLAVHQLAEAGRLSIIGGGRGRYGGLEVRLHDEVQA